MNPLKRKWEVVRCWATLVPQPTGHRYWRRTSAGNMAARLTLGAPPGMWFEIRPVDGMCSEANQ